MFCCQNEGCVKQGFPGFCPRSNIIQYFHMLPKFAVQWGQIKNTKIVQRYTDAQTQVTVLIQTEPILSYAMS